MPDTRHVLRSVLDLTIKRLNVQHLIIKGYNIFFGKRESKTGYIHIKTIKTLITVETAKPTSWLASKRLTFSVTLSLLVSTFWYASQTLPKFIDNVQQALITEKQISRVRDSKLFIDVITFSWLQLNNPLRSSYCTCSPYEMSQGDSFTII